MTLIKTSLLSFIATVVKLLAALVINKAVALYIGPSGLAVIGQFQNMLQLAMTASQGAINVINAFSSPPAPPPPQGEKTIKNHTYSLLEVSAKVQTQD